MRILFASTQGAGHFNPLVPFLEVFRRAGHEVLVVGPPSLDVGTFPFRPGAHPPDELLGPVWGAMGSIPPGQGDVVVIGTIFARLNVDAMLPTVRATIEEWQPDLVLREASEFASAIAADELDVPHARVAIGLHAFEEVALAFASPALEERRPGLTRRISDSDYLTCWPESLDSTAAPVQRFSDPALQVEPEPLPNWWPGDRRSLVYVTFGSVTAQFPPAAVVYGKAIEAVADLEARVLLTVGVAAEVDLSEAPANVHVEKWVPQADVLGHAAVVVGHGGAGTTLGALAAGVPLVVVPLFADQPWNGARTAIAGAGVVASMDGIRAGIELVLADDSYRAAAGAVADELRRYQAVDDYVTRPMKAA
ncbi:MAG: glycosyltransferase [Actinomycetota bacterium]|nr:glycosyltransferase [Actinomycetota bacterium]